MGLSNAIPALWAGKLLLNLNNAHVYANVVNRDYEGEIKGQGSSVKIVTPGDVTIYDYTRYTDLNGPDEPQDTAQILNIDQGKYFNFAIDDVDRVQAKPDEMNANMEQAAWKLADGVDTYIAAQFAANIPSTQQVTAATVGRGSGERNAYQVLIDLDIKLTETNTPRGGRWAVVPPWWEGFLRSDGSFVSYGTAENRRTLMRGEPIGQAAGFDIYVSNNVPTSGGNPVVMAGWKQSATYAEQIDKTETYRPEKRFSDAVKGLLVYGFKVTRPSNLASIVATRGA